MLVNIRINSLPELFETGFPAVRTSPDDDFRKAVNEALGNSIYFNRKSFVAISPKYEQKLLQDPELARELAEKINSMTSGFGSAQSNRVIVVDRSGELNDYSIKSYDKKAAQREYDERKEAERSRLRKKARQEAYFKIVQQISIKRKLVEQENLKRARGKRYSVSGTRLDSVAKSILGQPNNTYPFYF